MARPSCRLSARRLPGGSGSELGCLGRLRMPGGRRPRMARRAASPCSSTRARRSSGWHRRGWRRSWSGGASLSAGAGWSAPSWPRAGLLSPPRMAAPTGAG
eukprot:14633233-Alexandrium_andersonii.AAC.1